MGMNVWSCGKCGNAICKDSSPNLSGCTKGYHDWHNLGRVGRDNSRKSIFKKGLFKISNLC